MQSQRTLHVNTGEGNVRLDRYLAEECADLSRSCIQKLIKEGYARVNGIAARPSLRLKGGENIIVSLPPCPTLSPPLPEDIPLSLVYEDDDLVVIDKPPGLTVHPAPGHPSHTLVNALLACCSQLAPTDDLSRPGIVHRLDKDTSGLMMVAKNIPAYTNLTKQFKSRSVTKRYLVLVRGHLASQQGIIETPIGRNKRNRKRMTVTPDGRESCTYYQVMSYPGDHTLVEATLKTGRTHQIRVHFLSIDHPVIGDATYGVKSPFLKRQFLHSHYLDFKLPSTGKHVEFRSELPHDLQQALEQVQIAAGQRS